MDFLGDYFDWKINEKEEYPMELEIAMLQSYTTGRVVKEPCHLLNSKVLKGESENGTKK